MTTQNKAVTVYLPKNVEDFITGYCTEYNITRKDKEGNTLPSLGTGIIELLKLLAHNPELVGGPLPDTVPSTISEAAIEKKIEDILEKKLSNLPNTVPELKATTQRLDNWIGALSGRLNDWILAIDDRLSDCDQELSGKITSLENRLNALAIRLDSQKDSQQDSQRIDDMEYLLKREKECSVATRSLREIASPIPTIEGGNGDNPDLPPSPPNRPAAAIASIDGSVEPANTSPFPPSPDEPVRPALATEPEASASSAKKGLTDSELARHLGIDKSNVTRWKAKGTPTPKYRNWELRGRLWYEKD